MSNVISINRNKPAALNANDLLILKRGENSYKAMVQELIQAARAQGLRISPETLLAGVGRCVCPVMLGAPSGAPDTGTQQREKSLFNNSL